MGDCAVLDSWGVTLLLSFAFTGAEGPQPFQQIQQNEKDCLHGYVRGHQCVGCRDCVMWCDREPAACRKIRFASWIPMLHIRLACLSSEQESRVRMRPRRHRWRQKRLSSSTVNFQSETTTIKDDVCLTGLRRGGGADALSLLTSPAATSLSHLYLWLMMNGFRHCVSRRLPPSHPA